MGQPETAVEQPVAAPAAPVRGGVVGWAGVVLVALAALALLLAGVSRLTWQGRDRSDQPVANAFVP